MKDLRLSELREYIRIKNENWSSLYRTVDFRALVPLQGKPNHYVVLHMSHSYEKIQLSFISIATFVNHLIRKLAEEVLKTYHLYGYSKNHCNPFTGLPLVLNREEANRTGIPILSDDVLRKLAKKHLVPDYYPNKSKYIMGVDPYES